ncbi:hypothetical protein LCGC14_1825120 [marine sediment metagenome]|uniref:Uncharacterized protein n=1 Tax=marine sediment metagenome TaxID=412755 RepID=A0A0F9GHR0_9ZZZZ
MAVFGESYPKFKKISTVVGLNHSILIPTWRIPNQIKHRSIVNGVISYVSLGGDKMAFDVIVNIWKYAVPKTTMQALLAYNKDEVKFMPHEDSGEYIKETDNTTEADFKITIMRPFYLNNRPPLLKDKLLIRFESVEPTAMPLTVTSFLVDEGSDFLVDEEGDKLIKEL